MILLYQLNYISLCFVDGFRRPLKDESLIMAKKVNITEKDIILDSITDGGIDSMPADKDSIFDGDREDRLPGGGII